MGLRDFSIEIGPYHGAFTSCGLALNSVAGGHSKTYQCKTHTRGSALKISSTIVQHLALCRVVVHGRGTTLLKVTGIKWFTKM